MLDLQTIVHQLKERNVTLRATEQPINTSTATGKCFLDMLGCFAEFETNLRRERQMEGIAKAKEKGLYKGRRKTIDDERIKELKSSGMSVADISKQEGVSRMSVYRALNS